MTLEQFTELVSRMRQAQKDYFNHRQRETLELAKRLEKEVDKAIIDLKTPQLF